MRSWHRVASQCCFCWSTSQPNLSFDPCSLPTHDSRHVLSHHRSSLSPPPAKAFSPRQSSISAAKAFSPRRLPKLSSPKLSFRRCRSSLSLKFSFRCRRSFLSTLTVEISEISVAEALSPKLSLSTSRTTMLLAGRRLGVTKESNTRQPREF